MTQIPPHMDMALRLIGVVPRAPATPQQPPIDWSFKAVVGEPDF